MEAAHKSKHISVAMTVNHEAETVELSSRQRSCIEVTNDSTFVLQQVFGNL